MCEAAIAISVVRPQRPQICQAAETPRRGQSQPSRVSKSSIRPWKFFRSTRLAFRAARKPLGRKTRIRVAIDFDLPSPQTSLSTITFHGSLKTCETHH